jgi:hypothetical protein
MSIVSDALATLAANLQKDEIGQVLPVVDNYLEQLKTSKSFANDAAQTVSVEVQLQAALPNLASTAITDVAGAVKSLVDLEALSLQTPASTPSVPGSTTPAPELVGGTSTPAV